MLFITPPCPMVTFPSSLRKSSSLRVAIWMCLGVMRVLPSLIATFPESSITSATMYSSTAVMKTADSLPMRGANLPFFMYRAMRPVGNSRPALFFFSAAATIFLRCSDRSFLNKKYELNRLFPFAISRSFSPNRRGGENNKMVFQKTAVAKKAAPADAKDGVSKKASRKARTENYRIYITRVLKAIHPESSITREAVGVVNSFVHHLFTALATDAGKIAAFNKKNTITARELEAATSMNLPGNLASHAIEEAKKAITITRSTVSEKKTTAKKAAAK